jgi:hypothetical protein
MVVEVEEDVALMSPAIHDEQLFLPALVSLRSGGLPGVFAANTSHDLTCQAISCKPHDRVLRPRRLGRRLDRSRAGQRAGGRPVVYPGLCARNPVSIRTSYRWFHASV